MLIFQGVVLFAIACLIAGSEVLKGNIWVLISCFVCEHASWMSLGNIAVYNTQVRIQKQWLIQWCVDEQSYSKAWDCNQQCFRYKMFFQDQWHIVTRCRRSWPFLIIVMLGHSIVTAWRKKQLHPLKKILVLICARSNSPSVRFHLNNLVSRTTLGSSISL